MNVMLDCGSQRGTFTGNGTSARMKMGAIDIKNAVKQMDGVFGCKASFKFNAETKSNEFTFAKKTIVDFFCGLFASGDEKSEQSTTVIRALLDIQNQVGIHYNIDELKSLTTSYSSNHDLIDFKGIRKTLRNFSYFKFPPVVFTRSAEKAVEAAGIMPDKLDAQQAKIAGAGLNVSAPSYRSEQKAEGHHRLLENNHSGSVEENPDLDDMLEIEKFLSYDSVTFEVKKNRRLEIGEEKADASDGPSIEKAAELTNNKWVNGKEYWLSFYDNKLKAETFVQDGVTTIERDDEFRITNENLEAFCDMLIWVSKHEKMPLAIFGGGTKVNALVYEMLFKRDQDFAEKVKSILFGIV